MSHRLRIAFALLTTLSASCQPDRNRAEMKRILSRIDRMRDAPAQQRATAIEQLERETPTLSVSREAQHHCLTAYRALEQGHHLSANVQRAITAAAKSASKPTASAHQQLAEAEQAVQAAGKAMDQCARFAAALRRRAR